MSRCAKAFETRVAVLPGADNRLDLLSGLFPVAPQRSERGEQRLVCAVMIQQLALQIAFHQGLVFVLAVNIDQSFTEFAQQLQRHR